MKDDKCDVRLEAINLFWESQTGHQIPAWICRQTTFFMVHFSLRILRAVPFTLLTLLRPFLSSIDDREASGGTRCGSFHQRCTKWPRLIQRRHFVNNDDALPLATRGIANLCLQLYETSGYSTCDISSQSPTQTPIRQSNEARKTPLPHVLTFRGNYVCLTSLSLLHASTIGVVLDNATRARSRPLLGHNP